ADLNRERRLVAGLAALALDGVEEGGLLAADVGAGPAADLDVEREPPAQSVGAQQPRRARRLDRAGHPLGGQRVLAAQVEVAALAAGRVAGDRHALDDRERILFHQQAVLERARLGLVGVADQVVRPGRRLRDRVPLAPGGERGAAAADQLR